MCVKRRALRARSRRSILFEERTSNAMGVERKDTRSTHVRRTLVRRGLRGSERSAKQPTHNQINRRKKVITFWSADLLEVRIWVKPECPNSVQFGWGGCWWLDWYIAIDVEFEPRSMRSDRAVLLTCCTAQRHVSSCEHSDDRIVIRTGRLG
jgi:hypothetical protein